MLITSKEFITFAVLLFMYWSIRTDRASRQNFVTVAIGALTVWVAGPDSPWGKAISFSLAGLAITMSPLGALFLRTVKNFLSNNPKSLSKAPQDLANPYPINILHDPEDAEVDIVAVHGLGSSVETAWTHKKSGKLWLQDFLPKDIPKSRIMTFRHNSRWKSKASTKDLAEHGRQFLEVLLSERDKFRDRPLIFIGHSFGGLLIEQALVLAKEDVVGYDAKEQHESLANSMAGVIFLGTPHAGSSYSFWAKAYCFFNYWEGASPQLLTYLDPGSEKTAALEDQFRKSYPDLSFDFYEINKNVILGMEFDMVVSRTQGTRIGLPASGIDTDHFGLNKYESINDKSYRAVKDKIAMMLGFWKKKMGEKRDALDTRDWNLLKELEPCDFTPTMEKRWRNFTPGTCEWIVKEREYIDWINWSVEKNVLWISGIPGSGKTHFSQWICENLRKDDRNTVMYFFFDAKSDLVSLPKFYQTILHQLLERIRNTNPKLKAQCFEIVHKLIRESGPHETSYIEALRKMLHLAKQSFLIVDALDECKETETQVLRKWLAEIKGFPNLRIVVTSRVIQMTKKIREDPRHIHLDLGTRVDKLNEDIERFIISWIKREDSCFPAEMPRVVEELKIRSNGMILYARLILEILNKKATSEDGLLVEMNKLPKSLTALYATRLDNISENGDPAFAKRLLQWLVTCRRPLTVDGLRGVDIIYRNVWPKESFDLNGRSSLIELGKDRSGKDRFQEHLLENLLPLVEILSDRTVRLVHTTVSQFLRGEEVEERGAKCPAEFRVEVDVSHEHIAMTCVTYLRWSDSVKSTKEPGLLASLDNRDLHDYAVMQWPDHCEKSEARIVAREAQKSALLAFFRGETAFPAWLTARAQLDDLFRAHFGIYITDTRAVLPRPLHVAVFFNIWQFGRLLLEDSGVNICDATGSTALHIAAGQGYPLIVKELLEQGARMDLADASGAYPLHRAVRRGNHEALRQLLGANTGGAVINVADKYKFTPVHVACQLGWTECVKILLQHNASLSNDSGAIETPIGLAIENGHIDVVRALLQHDRALVERCREPLVQAARRGSTEMVKFLCEADVDTSHEDILGQTALHKACIFGNTDLVEYLLKRGRAPVDAKDKSQRTPLYFAAERGHLDVVNCLLQNNANKNSLDRRNETALFKPAGNGHTAVVESLLTAGTDATILDLWQRTPLQFAAMKGHSEIVRMLLKRTRINQDLPDWVGRTVLHNAAAWLREGQEGIIDILFEHGANPDTRDQDEGTALHAAIWRGPDQPRPSNALLGKLIDHGVSINAQNKNGRTALFYAAATQNPAAVSFLLRAGAAPGNQSLHAAVRLGDIALVKPFLEQPSTLDLAERDSYGNTPLHIAASEGYSDIVAALLGVGAPTRCLNIDQQTPLRAADEAHHPDTASLLKNKDPTPDGDLESRMLDFDISQSNTQDTLGRTLVHAAVLLGRLEVIQCLLEGHVDIETPDQIGRTPLHYAAQRVDPDITEALIIAGANVNAADARGRVPLYFAAEAGNVAQTRLFLAANAEMAKTDEGLTLMHAAISGGSAQIVRLLLETEKGGELLPAQNVWGWTAIHLAAELGNSDVLEELLNHTTELAVIDKQDSRERTALFIASEEGHLEAVRQLIRAGSIVYRTDRDRNMAIHLAAEKGHLEIVSLLLSELPSQVELAMEKWKEGLPGFPRENDYRVQALVEALIKAQAIVKDPVGPYWSADPSKWTTVEERQKLQTEVVSSLRRFDEERHSTSSTTVMRAVQGGHADVVKLLLDRVPEMPLQAEHYSISNVLSLAATQGHTDIAQLLISAGSQVNAITESQETCLHKAAEFGHTDMVELLLQNNANPDLARLRDGSLPLHLAARGGYEDTVRALVRVAFVNAVDDQGRTPLHVACLGSHSAVVDVLIGADADLLVRDFDRKSPLELAQDLSEKTRNHLEEQVKKQRQRRAAGH